MFNIGGGELLVIMLLALLVLGPQRLPDAARQAGKAMGELRRLSSGFQQELKNAMEEDPAPVKQAEVAAPVETADAAEKAAASPAPTPRPRRKAPLKAPRSKTS